jgi:hypothetical protein
MRRLMLSLLGRAITPLRSSRLRLRGDGPALAIALRPQGDPDHALIATSGA